MNGVFPVVFLILFLAPPLLIGWVARKTELQAGRSQRQANALFGIIFGFYLLYLTYVGFASLNGLFDQLMLPPKIMLFTFFPLLAFYFLGVFNLPFFKRIFKHSHTEDWIKIHVFRIIGSSFLILGLLGELPMPIALIAGLGDLTVALSAWGIAHAIRHQKPYAKRLALVWNGFGLLDIVLTSGLALFYTKLSLDTGAPGVEVLGSFPFCFIPAFAPATIIFLHTIIFLKLKRS